MSPVAALSPMGWTLRATAQEDTIISAFNFSGLHQVALGVADLERAVAFYEETLGAERIATFDPPGLAFFRLGPVRLLLERVGDAAPGSGVLYLEVGDIDASHAALAARGVAFTSGPHLIHRDAAGDFGAPGVEEWMAFFEDPDGNALALASRVAPVA